ncbi:unnamed protein product [Didymodactylos carnosus]|nr:unnamed protein product [Didymodactylos carnosus]CAF4289006.1 unnamed protein product [Didymodactylos carnosus]
MDSCWCSKIETNSPQQQASKNVQYNDYQIIDTTQSHASTTQTPLATNNNSYYQPNQKPSQVLPHTKLPNQNTPSNNTSNS